MFIIFFIKINLITQLDKRPIEDESDSVISSPCDGTILSFGEIKNFDEIIFIKQTKVSLKKFLFGNLFRNHKNWLRDLLNVNKRFFQITIYLSPGDCHRFYSPANINVIERIYIPGFLEPVRPSYVLRHPKLFAMNERVTLRCNYSNSKLIDDSFYITYVGALNVGSISLPFDDFLKTNSSEVVSEFNRGENFIINYSDFLKKYKLLKKKLHKDASDADNFKNEPFEEINKSNKIDKIQNFNMKSVLKSEKESNNISQLPTNLKLENFRISEKGLTFNKKDEMGWFNFGSTIVLVFSAEKEKEVTSKVLEGQKILIGESLFKIK